MSFKETQLTFEWSERVQADLNKDWQPSESEKRIVKGPRFESDEYKIYDT